VGRREPFGSRDDKLQELTNRLEGDESLAKSLIKRQANDYPVASFPELLVMHELDKRRITYMYQASFLGGRTKRGGLIVDFIVIPVATLMAWAIQGTYYHTRPGERLRGQIARAAIIGQYVNGQRIDIYVEIWEDRLYNETRRRKVIDAALRGQDLGR
jgi:hypothetical protein